jgi:hypothetical protein
VVVPPLAVFPPLAVALLPDPAEPPVDEALVVVVPPLELEPPLAVAAVAVEVPPVVPVVLLWLVLPPDDETLLELPPDRVVPPPFPALPLLDWVAEPELPPLSALFEGGTSVHAEIPPRASNVRMGLEENFMSTPLR